MLLSWVKSIFQKPAPVEVNRFQVKFPKKISASKLEKNKKVKLATKDPRVEASRTYYLDYLWAMENGVNGFVTPGYYKQKELQPENKAQVFEVVRNQKGKGILTLKGQDGVVRHLAYSQHTNLIVVD